MAKVILSSDQHPDYFFCTPITSFVWEYFGFKPVIIILGKSKYTDLVYEYVKKYTTSEIIEIDSMPPYKDSTIVQFSRLYASCFEKNEDEYLLTADIDMLTLNRYLYRDFDKMNLFGPDLTNNVYYPICYIGMTAKKWKNLLNLEYGKFYENMMRDLTNEKLATSEVFRDYWFTDQRFITTKIKEYGEEKFNIIPRGHHNFIATKRIDRLCWNFDPDLDYIDCHLLKPSWELANFNEIHKIVKNKIELNSHWMIEYCNQFNEIRKRNTSSFKKTTMVPEEFSKIVEATSLIRQKRFSDARDTLNAILRINPDSHIALTKLALIDLLEGREQKAWQVTADVWNLVLENTVPKIPHEQIKYILTDLLDLLDMGLDHWLVRVQIALTYLQYNFQCVQFREFLKTVVSPDKEIQKYFESVLNDTRRVEYQPIPIDKIPFEAINNRGDSDWVVITAASTPYFPQLINFIGSLHYHRLHRLSKIIVYDIGLQKHEKAYLEKLSKVRVKKVPRFYPHAFAWCTWKLWVLKDCAENEGCDYFLYCDTGLQIQNDLSPVFDLIHQHGYALFHYESLLTRDYATNALYKKLGLHKATDSTLQIVSGIQGYTSKDTIKTKVIDRAFQLAADERILRPSADCIDNRHDQSLLSLLLNMYDIQTLNWKPMIQPYFASEQEQKNEATIFYLCRQSGIGCHDQYLVRKKEEGY